MSFRLKKAARSLRHQMGLSLGIRPARPDEVCTKPLVVRKYVPEGATEEVVEFRMCGERAHVVEAAGKTTGGELVNKLCYECMKVEHKPRHDQKLTPAGRAPKPNDTPKYDGAIDERMGGLWKRSRELAAHARTLETARPQH